MHGIRTVQVGADVNGRVRVDGLGLLATAWPQHGIHRSTLFHTGYPQRARGGPGPGWQIRAMKLLV